jgi:hypothetical protein
MSTLIDCPSCERKLRVPAEFLGKSVRCPSCGETFRSPEPAAVAAPSGEAATAPPAVAEGPPLLTVPLKLELDEEPAARKPAAPPAETPRRDEGPPRRRRPDPDDEDDEPYERRRRRRRREFEPCPRCGDDVRRGAVACPYCGLDLEEQGDGYTRQRRVRLDAEPHRGGLIQGLGITSIVLSVVYLFPISLPVGIAAWLMGRSDLRKMNEGVMDPDGRRKTRDGWLCGIVGTVWSMVCAFFCLGIIVLAVTEASQAPPPPPPAFGARPGWQVPPPPPQAQPALNNFTARRPAPITLKPGETKVITVTVDRMPNFRGTVAVNVLDGANDLGGLTVDPDQAELRGVQSTATFNVTAERDTVPGERLVRFNARSNLGDMVIVELRVTVVGRR